METEDDLLEQMLSALKRGLTTESGVQPGLVPAVLSWLESRGFGSSDLLGLLQQKGFGDSVSSWVGTGSSEPSGRERRCSSRAAPFCQ